MSMKTYITYGYGVSEVLEMLYEAPYKEKACNFLRTHDEDFRDVLSEECIKNNADATEIIRIAESYYDYYGGYLYGISDCIIDWCKKNFGITLEYVSETECSPNILVFTEKMPWLLNQREKNLTTDMLLSVFADIFDMFGIDERTVAADFGYKENEVYG